MSTTDRTLHRQAALTAGRPAPHIPPRRIKAHVIKDDAEAIAVAKELARDFAVGAAERDRQRRLPVAEIERLSQSGLWAITVPKAYGGAGVSTVTLAEVTAIISAADSSIGQIPQNHFYMVEALRLSGSDEQKAHYFQRVLDGDRLGNAFTEIGTKTPVDYKTHFAERDGKLLLNGQKFYATGSLFAHIIVAVAKGPNGRVHLVFIDRATPGLDLVDDWTSFGQRSTGSGTVTFDDVEITPFQVVDHDENFDKPTPMGPFAQIIHSAVQVGIARGALAETISYVRAHARPFFELSIEHGYEDPHTIHAVGDVSIRVHAADALLARAGRILDIATANPTAQTVAEASIAVAEVKALGTEVAQLAATKLIELGGARSTLEAYGLDRYWRNARTHSLHDPVRWKYHHIGNFYLNDQLPPRHGAI
ncbi:MULTISPECIES: SfnB family sulfur acquisition oxidoreductase [Rhizobium/Agrobacterium group]|uniref:SfnB family sulfur acquisition oxidoreductase n=1 Tax=Rhizobium/Agrobacterium group TaxID=227290 RepID=UPI000B3FBA7C|nr:MULTISPECIES: SfnB family sulfur acquisition oxidoreductase [Rhizobium/Agrobacterium group]MCF1480821.1 SfnB family sulfur acquisition oxidoreductase [Allorhizobium ampelinum]NSZ44673.1 SfnB family sulfur acquisition oxidoreductase [Agrobacterium vitis]NTA28420.1 SfnB family sulfur acquisition oxidoreductase [Allorhizobium ampelinum]OVE93046.1 SfnB family sulfur acquisition oxidoreductase [Allorhizobium ampelinum]